MDLRDKRTLVTGGGGFLGSYLLDDLAATLNVTPDVPRAPHRPPFSNLRPAVIAPRSSYCDLRDPVQVNILFAREIPDVVFHLAANVGGIGANQAHPGAFFRDNILMGVNVLEAARCYDVKKVVVVGTVCSYPKFAPVPFREDDLWSGYPEETNAPYGVAKKAILVMAQAYRREFGLDTAFVLPANLYGPRDNFDLETSHVVPAMVRKFVEAKAAGSGEVVLWGDGSPTREFLHARDAAEGIRLAAERYDSAEPVNLGTGREVSMRSLATCVALAVGYGGDIRWDASRPNGQPRRALDTTWAKETMDFEARTDLQDGIAETVAWYVANKDRIAVARTR